MAAVTAAEPDAPSSGIRALIRRRRRPPMLRPILLGLSLLVVLLAAAACQAGPSNLLTGSGTVRSEARPVGAFDEVELAGVGTLTITQGPQESLTIEAEDNLLPQIRGEVRGRRLVLGPDGGK